MKIRKTLYLCGLVVLSTGVGAESSALSGEALGQLESIRTVCSRVKPDEAAKIDEQIRAMTGDVSEKTLAEVRKTAGYQRVYQSMLAEAAQAKSEQATEACARFLEMGQPRELESKATD